MKNMEHRAVCYAASVFFSFYSPKNAMYAETLVIAFCPDYIRFMVFGHGGDGEEA